MLLCFPHIEKSRITSVARINDQRFIRFIEVDREFILKSEAEKYIKEHPICIKRLPNCFFIRWLELHEVVFNEDCCEAGLNLLGFSELFAVSKLDLMNVPIVSNFDLISALNKAAKENL